MSGRPYRELNLARAERLHAQGHSWSAVAKLMGVHRNTIVRAQRDAGVAESAITTKRCPRCGRNLLVEKFSIDRSRRDGRNPTCRRCVREKWKSINQSPCVDCGGPRSSVTPGQCVRCYRMVGLLKRTEREAITLIPGYIYEAQAPMRAMMRELAASNLSPVERLRILMEQTNGSKSAN
jgi:hypothetical protein